MTLATLEIDRNRLRAVSNLGARRKTAVPTERVSDVWPDWSTEAAGTDPAKAVEKNKLSVVLWETARAIVISIGMVILLMVILSVLQANVGRWLGESAQSVSPPALLKADQEENTMIVATSHLEPQGIAARQYAVTHSKTRICALIDFRPVGDVSQNVWCIL